MRAMAHLSQRPSSITCIFERPRSTKQLNLGVSIMVENHFHQKKVDFVDVCTPFPRQGGPPRKKVPLGIRLKSTRPSHGRFIRLRSHRKPSKIFYWRDFHSTLKQPLSSTARSMMVGQFFLFPGADGRLPIRPRGGRVYDYFYSFTAHSNNPVAVVVALASWLVLPSSNAIACVS